MGAYCRCAEPMPVPDDTGRSEIGSMCFGCDLPMDEESCRGLYEDDPRDHASGRDPNRRLELGVRVMSLPRYVTAEDVAQHKKLAGSE